VRFGPSNYRDLTKFVFYLFNIEMPYGQVPILEFDDAQGNRHQLAQSQTICRFIGKKFGKIKLQ
jgi:glutathione S-transferase